MAGSPLSLLVPPAMSFGIITVTLSIWVLVRLWRAKESLVASAPLLSLVAFVALTAVAACDRRMGVGLDAALASRYCGITAFVVVALYIILTRIAQSERQPADSVARGVVLGLLLVGVLSSLFEWSDAAARSAFLKRDALAVRTATMASDQQLIWVYPNPETVRELAPFLERHGYSLFHHVVPSPASARYEGNSTKCFIDTINNRVGPGEVHRQNETRIKVEGWAVDETAGDAARWVYVSFDDKIDLPAFTGLARPDVADYFHRPGYAWVGFTAEFRASLLPDGWHTLKLKVLSADGARYKTCGSLSLHMVE